MPAGEVSVRLNLNKDGYSAGMTAARKEAAALGDAFEKVGHGGVSQMQAVSAAIRGIDMSTNIRAVERFLTTIPGVGAALQAAFPVVGALAFAGVLVRMGEEVAKFVKQAQEMPQKISAGFESLNLSAQTANDELNVTNDRIENQIAKLEHKPQNNLKLALDEAKLSADQFAKSVEGASNSMIKLIEENKVTFLQSLVSNNERTGPLAGTIKSFEQQKTHLAAQRSIAADRGDAPGFAANDKAFNDKEQKELEAMQAALKDATGKQFGGDELDQTPIMTMAQGVIDNIEKSRAHKDSLDTHSADETKRAQDEAADQASKAAAEAQRKAQELLLKQDEEAEKKQNAFNKLSINEEIQFWTDRIGAFTRGGEQYIAVQDKIYDLIAKRPSLFSENKKNQAAVGKSQVEGTDILSGANKALQEVQVQQWDRMAESAKKYETEVSQGALATIKETAAFDEASVAIGLQSGAISGLAAAQDLAAIHAKEHADAIDAVNKALADQIALINLNETGQDRTDAIGNAQEEAGNKIGEIQAQGRVQSIQDQQAISSQQFGPAMQQTLSRIAQDWTSMTQSIIHVTTQALDSFNSDITKAASGGAKASDFGHTFLAAGQGLFKTGLEKMEGNVLKAFGLGGGGSKKPTGAQGDAIHTIIDQGGIGGPGGSGVALGTAGNALFRPFIGGQQGQGSQSGGGIGGFFHSLMGGLFKLPGNLGTDSDGMPLGFQGGFAGGGDVLAGRPAMVGEQGPEMIVPRTASRIVPNSQLGGGDTHFHIDARGSSDPAAIHAAVMRAAPHIVAASMQAQHSSGKRSPAGR